MSNLTNKQAEICAIFAAILAHRMKSLGVVDFPALPVVRECVEFLLEGQKVSAIKHLRECTEATITTGSFSVGALKQRSTYWNQFVEEVQCLNGFSAAGDELSVTYRDRLSLVNAKHFLDALDIELLQGAK